MAVVVTDPAFYAAAVPAVLLIGLAKSGFAAGFGALSTPLLALVVPAPEAAAIMLPVLLATDAVGLQRLWRERDPALLRRLLPSGLVGTVLGMLLFGLLSPHAVSAMVGALTLAFLVQRLAFPPRPQAADARRWVGPVCAAASGLTSFVAHAGAPPIQAYVLSLKLPPLRFAGTMAVFFATLNISKVVPYAALGLLDLDNLATAALLVPLTPVGVWAGVRLARRVDPAWFYRLAYAGMAVAGVKLLWDGLLPWR